MHVIQKNVGPNYFFSSALKVPPSDFIQNMSQALSKCLKKWINLIISKSRHSIWKILVVLCAYEYPTYLYYDFFFRGAQVDVRNKKGNSSLWLAANGGHLDVVQLLHSAGADIDSQDNRKVSCLMAAFRKGHSKVVKWMVKHVSQFPSDTELTRYIATISGTN